MSFFCLQCIFLLCKEGAFFASAFFFVLYVQTLIFQGGFLCNRYFIGKTNQTINYILCPPKKLEKMYQPPVFLVRQRARAGERADASRRAGSRRRDRGGGSAGHPAATLTERR
eukprot:TRINITY_DN8261_c1_g1_i1.p3 TRINITY_DN8261_c1_g1~~TRINITY_DN8261_c1_g1_i1.p3  ORF type:complete len:113 (-),score=9.78 TRINITY_DN8261_c1_g1_i1:25-363(-)